MKGGAWFRAGARSCAHYLNWRIGWGLAAARERVRVARALGDLPLISEALGAGKISYSKVRAITRIATPENEDVLVDYAYHNTASQIEKVVRGYRNSERAQDDALEERRHLDRELTTWTDDSGMVVIRARLSPELGAAVLKALEVAEAELPPGGDGEQGAGVGNVSAVASERERPTASQRRADALGLMAQSALDHQMRRGSAGDRTQVVLHVDVAADTSTDAHRDSHCAARLPVGELGVGRLEPELPVGPQSVRRLSCDASVVTMLHGADGSVLDVGRKTRTIPPAIRRALQARDPGCQVPACSHTRYLEAHHVEHWADGGETKLSNLINLCSFHVLRLEEDSPRYEIHKDRVELELSHTWTEIVIAELHEAASRQLVGRRLADYLAEELRGQLLQREVELRLVDRLARGRAQREFRVLPRRFKGVPLPELKTLAVEGHRPARLQLHYIPPEMDETGKVGLSASGTMVLDDLGALEGLDHPPWNSGRLLGLIDFAELEVAPGSRRGFVPNAAAEALLRALTLLEADLESVLGRFEEERKRESDAALLKQLQRLFRDFGRRLPSYELFEVREESAIGGKGAGSGPGAGGAESEAGEAGSGEDEADALIGDVGASAQSVAAQAELFLPGPLETVEIRPADVRLEPGQARSLRAVARDSGGRRLGDDVGYSWSLMDGAELARLRSEDGDEDVVLGDRVRLEAGNVPGKLIVSVTAVQAERDATAEVTVLIDETLFGGTNADLGIPEPHPIHAPGESWRSRLTDGRWEYNSGHQDYLATVEDSRRKLRYVATLLAKELVFKRHQRPEVSDMLEQMVEVLSWAERRMPR